MPSHPPCGLYRTTRPLGELPAGLLVSFHDHGDPGPGVYLPGSWNLNRAQWQERGHTVPDADWSSSLSPLPAEGLYTVKAAFFCCERRCARFEANQLVQLGYDGQATPLLFVPEWTSKGLGFPEKGTRLDDARLAQLTPLVVARAADAPKDLLLH